METKILITYKWSLLQIEDLVFKLWFPSRELGTLLKSNVKVVAHLFLLLQSILAVKPVTFIG